MADATARVVLYVRDGCHLCDRAREVVAGGAAAGGAAGGGGGGEAA
ncbi:MAG: glutaredoxin family protein, partial [Cellulomonas sp.]|nr:glutaredoxin family protein [Cellulomonas sp.]